MRILKETMKSGIKISLFLWQEKLIIKYEIPGLEQSFKIARDDKNLDDFWIKLQSDESIASIRTRFEAMSTDLNNFEL